MVVSLLRYVEHGGNHQGTAGLEGERTNRNATGLAAADREDDADLPFDRSRLPGIAG